MTSFLSLLFGVLIGMVSGALIGFGAALITMTFDGSTRLNGTFGMTEVITMVPAGALIGAITVVIWNARRG